MSSKFFRSCDLSPVQYGFAVAINNPSQFTIIPNVVPICNNQDQVVEWRGDVFVVGRDAKVTEELLGKVKTIRCKIFLSLGRIKLKRLNIYADTIVLVNRCKVRTLKCNAVEDFVAMGCLFRGRKTTTDIQARNVFMKTFHHEIPYEGTPEEHEACVDRILLELQKDLRKPTLLDLIEPTEPNRSR